MADEGGLGSKDGTNVDAPVGGAARAIPLPPAGGAENPRGWGYADTRFEVLENGNVVLTGTRYNLCGSEMPRLLPWMAQMLASPLNPQDRHEPLASLSVPAPAQLSELLVELHRTFQADQLSQDDAIRLRHAHGHTGLEIYALLYGELRRVPDLVVYPTSEEQVQRLVTLAEAHDVALVPYGGGTNVTKALECPEAEQRAIVSVDMRRMNRIEWLDRENGRAKIQAGAAGREIMAALRAEGLTMGHEPDSVEFSTLGGWIATNCSGMKKNRYGNIEDIVLDLTAITAHGAIQRFSEAPRESAGLDARRCFFGSEGTLGIVTSAVVKVQPLPEAERFGSVIFPTFEQGFQFLFDVQRENALPTSIRLIDNTQFHFGMALKSRPTWWQSKKNDFMRWVLTSLKGVDLNSCALATLVFEGNANDVRERERRVARIAARHGGIPAGPENGERGYNLTFGIAYLRDLVFRHHMIAESFETSVVWSRALELCRRVRERCFAKHLELGLPGQPFFTLRVTQLYPSGVCIYFYLGFYAKGVADPMGKYAELEDAARDEIIDCGGSLSHHHGVGKLRARFLDRIQSSAMNTATQHLKKALDPHNVFASGNQGLSPKVP